MGDKVGSFSEHGQGTIGGYHHAYKTWGRTKGPKNIAGPPGTEVVVLSGATSLRISESAYKTAGYATENQRYLHVLVEDATTSNDPSAVSIMGYCHAFERWFNIAESTSAGEGPNTAPSPAAIDIGNISGHAPSAQLPAHREYRRYEIVGVDRVAFTTAGTPAHVNVFAACSTF